MNDSLLPATLLKLQSIVSGQLVADPQRTTTQAGKACVKAQLRTESYRVFVTAMYDAADDLAELQEGDQVSISGMLSVSPNEFRGKPGLYLMLFASRLVSIPKTRKKAKPVSPAASHALQDDEAYFGAEAGDLESAFPDDLPEHVKAAIERANA